MDAPDVERRLAAILVADVVGYSRLMGDDDVATVAALNACRDLFSEQIQKRRGRVVNAPGDSILAEFASVVDAVAAAVELQRELAGRNAEEPEARAMRFRIGINLGDVVVDQDAIYGDGVNIAARLESLAEPGGICIARNVYDQVENKLPIVCEYIGEQQVKNIAKPVRAYRVLPEAEAEQPRADTAMAADRPHISIAVLPFANMSGDPEQEYFCDGITEEIITELTRFPLLNVIARNSTFRYKGQAVDVREVGRELGAQYVLEGSVRRSGNRIRVAAQLLDAHDGVHLWAETYDRDLTAADIFDIQDDLTSRIVGIIADTWGVLARTLTQQIQRKRTDNLEAFEWVLKSAEYYGNKYGPESHGVIREGLERAVELDPEYADAWASLANIYKDEFSFGFNRRPNAIERCEEAARRALRLDPPNAFAQMAMAYVYYWRGELDAFESQSERLNALYPNGAFTLALTGLFMVNGGRREKGLKWARKAIALNPKHGNWYWVPIISDHLLNGDYQAALECALKIEMPEWWLGHAYLAVAYAKLERLDEARTAADKLLELISADELFELLNVRLKSPPLRREFFDGLRKAGLDLPEE